MANRRENVEATFLFLGSKITANGDWSQEISRWLLLGRKAVTNVDSVLKSKDTTLLKKVHIVKAMVYPIVMYGCENWTIKKAEHQRIDTFKLWFWRRFLRVPWTARRSNQSILKEISPVYSLEKTLILEKIEGRKRKGFPRMSWLDSITDSMDVNLGRFQEMVKDRKAGHAAVHGVPKSQTWLGD